MKQSKLTVASLCAAILACVAYGALAGESAEESVAALKSGEALYQKGEYALSSERLEAALTREPGNAQALLFAGLAEVRLDNPQKAAALWGRYQEVAKDEKSSTEIGRMRTILLREAAERAAKDAVAREKQLAGQSTDPRTVAVETFRNAGSAEYGPLGKALAAMMIDNLSALPGVKVLEREQVQALEEEAKLGASGLVEKGTAVRAGKLLRAGSVAAGSHVDWTASPPHLKLDALLVDVDAGTTVAETKSEAFASEFYKLVPAVAEKFAAALGQPVSQLPPPAKQKVEQEHTHSLEAALAFGQALDGLDRHDTEAALKACKELEHADPNFELAKKKCGFVPLTWLSMQGVAASVEPTAFAMASIGAAGGTYWPAVVGALVVGGIAGGTYAAVGGGGGGGGGNNNPPGNNPPQLNGVSDRTVGAGQTASIDMDCRDPDGTATTISNPNPAPGGSFSQTSGNPSTARYRQTTNQSQVGESFTTSFTCADSGTPPASTSQSATIRVVGQPQPLPTATPQPTPIPCESIGADCNQNTLCCSGTCDSELLECCAPLNQACSNDGQCCTTTASAAICQAGRCCVDQGNGCPGGSNGMDIPDGGCCSGLCYFGQCE
jgi:tetratricopeptide (TPR) repeat protein